MSWHVYINKKDEDKEIKEKIRNIMINELLEFPKLYGVNAFKGSKIQLARNILEKISRLFKHYDIICNDGDDFQECQMKAKTEYDFDLMVETYWPEALYESDKKTITTDKILKIWIRAYTEDSDDKEYNKIIKVKFGKITIWTNPHLDWDDHWPL